MRSNKTSRSSNLKNRIAYKSKKINSKLRNVRGGADPNNINYADKEALNNELNKLLNNIRAKNIHEQIGDIKSFVSSAIETIVETLIKENKNVLKIHMIMNNIYTTLNNLVNEAQYKEDLAFRELVQYFKSIESKIDLALLISNFLNALSPEIKKMEDKEDTTTTTP